MRYFMAASPERRLCRRWPVSTYDVRLTNSSERYAISRFAADAMRNIPTPLASRIVKYSPSFGRPRTSGERSDIQTAASSERPSRSLKKTLKASSTSMRPKSHDCGTPARSPRAPTTPGSRSVAASANTAAMNATVPGHSPASRPRTRSIAMTARIAPIRTSSGPKKRRLSTAPIRALPGRDPRRGRRRFHLIRDLDEARALQVQDGLRIDAEEGHDDDQRHEREELAAVDLPAGGGVAGIRGPEVHPLQRPQHVAGGQHDRARRDHGECRIRLPRAEQHQHLRDERRQSGDAHRGEEGEAGDAGVERHDRREPAEAVDVTVVRAVVDHADEKEQ